MTFLLVLLAPLKNVSHHIFINHTFAQDNVECVENAFILTTISSLCGRILSSNIHLLMVCLGFLVNRLLSASRPFVLCNISDTFHLFVCSLTFQLCVEIWWAMMLLSFHPDTFFFVNWQFIGIFCECFMFVSKTLEMGYPVFLWYMWKNIKPTKLCEGGLSFCGLVRLHFSHYIENFILYTYCSKK